MPINKNIFTKIFCISNSIKHRKSINIQQAIELNIRVGKSCRSTATAGAGVAVTHDRAEGTIDIVGERPEVGCILRCATNVAVFVIVFHAHVVAVFMGEGKSAEHAVYVARLKQRDDGVGNQGRKELHRQELVGQEGRLQSARSLRAVGDRRGVAD